MNRLSAFLTGLCLVQLSCSLFLPGPTPTPALPPGTDPFQITWEDRSIFEAGLVASEQRILDELDGASVYHIEFNIADELDYIKGTQEVRYTNAEDAGLNEVRFRLFPNILGGEMTISNLRADGESVNPKYELENSLMIVPFSAPLEPGQSLVLEMDFDVTVPRTLGSNYGVLAYVEDVLALAHAYPMIAVFDDEGWNAEIPPESGDVTYADASFYIVRVHAPLELVVVTSGREIDRSEAGKVQTLVAASGPARDFYLAASPVYEELSQTFGEVTVRSYAPRESRQGAQMALEVAANAIGHFSARYAPYPYTEFDIVSTPTLALGIEYPAMTAITSRIYDVHSDYRGAPASVYMESTVAHEVGHQWFYNLVGDDQLDDPWLDEALTQFITLQYYADEYGPNGAEGFHRSLEGRWASVGNADIPIGLPVAAYSRQEYSGIVYGRGPLFFVALREEIGTDAFDRFIRDYSEALSWDIATPETLKTMAEEHCSCDLTQLFEEWVY
ncbi:MAG TPA: M1 family metallopeptidase [Anaerolineales bacterium]|nr:M1 family metallopeptidase [Anaerolineales bacterium]